MTAGREREDEEGGVGGGGGNPVLAFLPFKHASAVFLGVSFSQLFFFFHVLRACMSAICGAIFGADGFHQSSHMLTFDRFYCVIISNIICVFHEINYSRKLHH